MYSNDKGHPTMSSKGQTLFSPSCKNSDMKESPNWSQNRLYVYDREIFCRFKIANRILFWYLYFYNWYMKKKNQPKPRLAYTFPIVNLLVGN